MTRHESRLRPWTADRIVASSVEDLYIDGDDFPFADYIQDVGEVEGAAPFMRSRFNDEVGLDFGNDLLIDPDVQRAF
jgi:hypothetical protein